MAKLQLGSTEKAYGDVKTLDTFKAQTKPLPVSGAPAPQRGPGRPAGGTQAPQVSPETGGLPPEHLSMMQQLARAEQVDAYWQNLVQIVPTPFTQMYARRARAVRDGLALRLYKQTPNFS